MRSSSAVYLAMAAILGVSSPVVAQDRAFNFALSGGASVGPAYPGSDDFEAKPKVGFTFGSLTWGGKTYGNGIGVVPDNGLSLRGALNIINSRDVDDNPELAGLEDIDTAVELGLNLTYRQTNWLAFGEVRQGFGGHEGVTGTLGADLIFRPTDRWTVTAGPRINLGNSEYATTYFGISGADAAASSFSAYDAGGGVLGAGLQVGATYEINESWAFKGLVSYEKLLNDAADSPITQAGSEDQFRVSFGLSRAFTLRF